MKQKGENSAITALSALVLLCVFAAGMIAVLLTGVEVYRRISDSTARSYDSRTIVQYLATKVRQASDPDGILLSCFGDGTCLRIEEQVEAEKFQTRIYIHDGWLMEVFASVDEDLSPGEGERILPVRSFDGTVEGNLIRLAVLDETGRLHTVVLALRGERTP